MKSGRGVTFIWILFTQIVAACNYNPNLHQKVYKDRLVKSYLEIEELKLMLSLSPASEATSSLMNSKMETILKKFAGLGAAAVFC